jgi:hypothetical protein
MVSGGAVAVWKGAGAAGRVAGGWVCSGGRTSKRVHAEGQRWLVERFRRAESEVGLGEGTDDPMIGHKGSAWSGSRANLFRVRTLTCSRA